MLTIGGLIYLHKTTKKVGDKTYHSYLIQQSYRENGKVKHRTLANLSGLSLDIIQKIEKLLKGDKNIFEGQTFKLCEQKQGKNYGGLKVIFEVAKKLNIVKVLGTSFNALLSLLIVAGIIIIHKSKYHISNFWAKEEAIEEVLNIKKRFDEDDLYKALAWLSKNQDKIEEKLFKESKKAENTVFMYDITSSYVYGKKMDLTDFGYNRDKKKGTKQIVIGLMTDKEGDPISVEVFKGNTVDSTTVLGQLQKMKERFNVKDVVFIGDRGMIKKESIEKIKENNWKYITTITKAEIEKLINEKVIDMSLFDEKLCEIEYENERYIFRKNPLREEEILNNYKEKESYIEKRKEKANKYLEEHKKAKVETKIKEIKQLIEKLKLVGYEVSNNDRKIILTKNEEIIKEHFKLAGCYCLKTNVSKSELNKEEVHTGYKNLSKVEQAFETLKTGLLNVRPIFLRKEAHIRGHVFACFLALKITNYIQNKCKELELPVEYIIRTLDNIQYIENIFEGQTFKTLPSKLNEDQERILKTLDIKLPKRL